MSRSGGAWRRTKNHEARAGPFAPFTASNAAQNDQAWSTCTSSAAASTWPKNNSKTTRAEEST